MYDRLNFYYDKNISLPSYTYLIPVINNSNPYYVVKGNPTLLPAEKHNLSLNYYYNNIKRKLNFNFYSNVSFINNDVVQSITVDPAGVQTTLPVNANGSRSGYLNFNINKQYKSNKNVMISWNTGGYYSYNRNSLLYNGNNSRQSTWYLSHWNGFSINFNDKVEWNNSYDLTYNLTTFTTKEFKRLTALQQTLNTELIIRVPKHIIWETNINYDHNGNVPAGLPKDAFRINFAVNFTMLKDEKAVF